MIRRAAWRTSSGATSGHLAGLPNADRTDVLLISSENDHIMPPKVPRSNAKHYRADVVTEENEFPERPHPLPAQDGWQYVADYAWPRGRARDADRGKSA